jgi:lysophospholipase L1-like esterase
MMSPKWTHFSTRRLLCISGQRRVFSWLVGACFAVASVNMGPSSTTGQDLSRHAPQTSAGSSEISEKDLRQASREKWATEIEKLRDLDNRETYPDDSVLFVGSSSIRMWNSIAEDVAPLVPIRRGFGGARSVDLAVFGPELIRAHRYAALVVFVANDISGEEGKPDHSPEDVVAWLREVYWASRDHQPDAPILLVEITPTESRRHVWQQQRTLNHRLREWTFQESNIFFLPTAEYFLDAQDQVRSELFVEDRLHLSQPGYQLWGRLIRQRLQELLRGSSAGIQQRR